MPSVVTAIGCLRRCGANSAPVPFFHPSAYGARMNSGLPILTAPEMRAAEQAAVVNGTPLALLMERAGEALGRLVQRVASGRPVHILVGPGNNGGDGYVAARWLAERGVAVTVSALAQPTTELAKNAAALWNGPVGGVDHIVAQLSLDDMRGGLEAQLDRIRQGVGELRFARPSLMHGHGSGCRCCRCTCSKIRNHAA